MLADASDLAVLALLEGKGEPRIVSLPPLHLGLDRRVADSIDRYSLLELRECALVHIAVNAHAITPRPAGCRQFEPPFECSVICQEQQAFTVVIEPADGKHSRQTLGQSRKDCR